jgi:hypothetical protein
LNIKHEQLMAADMLVVMDAKTTGIMLYESPVPSPDTHPFRLFAFHGTEKLCSTFRYISSSTSDVLDFFTEILILYS